MTTTEFLTFTTDKGFRVEARIDAGKQLPRLVQHQDGRWFVVTAVGSFWVTAEEAKRIGKELKSVECL